MKTLAGLLLGLALLTACTETPRTTASSSPLASVNVAPSGGVKMVTREDVERADSAVRDATANLEQLCSAPPTEPLMCSPLKPFPGSPKDELNKAVHSCSLLVDKYNALVEDGLITSERITPGVTANARFGGKITCSASK